MALEHPLLRRELVGLLRTRRAFWLLVALVAASTLIPLAAWPAARQTADYGRNVGVFIAFALTQLTAALLIIPAFTAGAISGERERGTYELLYTTLLSPLSIVLSKLLASSGYVLVLLIATAPSVCILYLNGGISFDMVAVTYLSTFAAVVSSGLICLTASMRSRRTAHAVVRGIIWVALWNIGWMAISMLSARVILVSQGEQGPPPEWLWASMMGMSPYTAIVPAIEPIPQLMTLPLRCHHVYYIYATLVGGGHLLYLLRRVRTPDIAASPRRQGRTALRGRPRPVRRALLARLLIFLGEEGFPLLDNPVFLKEVRTEFFSRPWYRRTAFWASLGLFTLASFVDDDFLSKVFPVGFLAIGFIALIGCGVAASSIPREVEQGNLDLLRGTLIPLPRVLEGKFLAALFAILGIAAAAGLVLIGAPAAGRGATVEWYLWSLAVCAVVISLTAVFTAALASFFAAISRRTLGALVGAYLAGFLIFVGLPLVGGMVLSSSEWPYETRRSWEGWLASLNPFWALVESIEDYRRTRGRELSFWFYLGPFVFFYTLATLALWALSAALIQRFKLRDR